MLPFMRVTITITICCIALIIANNLSGFFIKPSDDPSWTDLSVQQKDAANTSGSAADNSPGAKIFSTRCASCHQNNGQGMPGIYPPLAGSEWVQGEPTRPIRIVLSGFQGKINRAGKDYNGVMTPWKDLLNDEEIAQVLTYIRSAWDNKGDAIEAKLVAEIRAKTAAKPGSYAEDELKNPL